MKSSVLHVKKILIVILFLTASFNRAKSAPILEDLSKRLQQLHNSLSTLQLTLNSIAKPENQDGSTDFKESFAFVYNKSQETPWDKPLEKKGAPEIYKLNNQFEYIQFEDPLKETLISFFKYLENDEKFNNKFLIFFRNLKKEHIENIKEIKDQINVTFDSDNKVFLQLKNSNLRMCGCPQLSLNERLFIIALQLNEFIEKFKNKSTKYVIASLGGGKLLQLYLLISALASAGYQDLRAISIDPESDNQTLKKEFTENLQSKFSNLKIQIFSYKSDIDFVKSVKNNPTLDLKPHSFDAIDTGEAESPPEFINNLTQSLSFYNRVTLSASWDKKLQLSQNNIVISFGNKSTQTNLFLGKILPQDDAHEISNAFHELFTRDESDKDVIIQKITEIQKKIAKKKLFKDYSNPKKPKDSSLYVALSNSIPYAFANIVNNTKAVEKPLIYLAEEHRILSFEKEYNPESGFYFWLEDENPKL